MKSVDLNISKLILVNILLLASSSIGLLKANDIKGLWLTSDGRGKIQISVNSEGIYVGHLVWTDDKSEKGKKLQNAIILVNCKKTSDFTYKGNVCDPRNKDIYSCTITVKRPDELILRGYIGLPILGKTERWTRVNN